MTKTCGECKHLNRELAFCRACGARWLNDNDGANCRYFEQKTPPTNGDRIRQMSREELAKTISGCSMCVYQHTSGGDDCSKSCFEGHLAWLNAPADDVCVKQNGNHDTQPGLCVADNTESEGEDE